MEATGFEHYLPLVERVRRYPGGDVKRTELPLFTGYVFACVPPQEKRRIYEQELVARALDVVDEAAFLRQMEQVRLILASGIDVIVRPLFAKGQRVRVTQGPLRGVVGCVDDPANPRGILVAMDVLQQGVLVPLDPDWIEVAE